MTVLATREGGWKLVYDYTENEYDYGYVVNPEGEKYPTLPVDSILARGYWTATGKKPSVKKTIISKNYEEENG